jgi:hypothetical protein
VIFAVLFLSYYFPLNHLREGTLLDSSFNRYTHTDETSVARSLSSQPVVSAEVERVESDIGESGSSAPKRQTISVTKETLESYIRTLDK